MAKEFISTFPNSPGITSMDYFAGVKNNGDGTFTNYKYTLAQIIAASKKKITALTANISTTTIENDTLQDPFFANPVTEIVTDQQSYIVGDDFTVDQEAMTITGIAITFINEQNLIAKL